MSNLRTFLASTESILEHFDETRRETVLEAMKRMSKQTLQYIHSMYVRDLYSELVEKQVPTNTIANLAEKICRVGFSMTKNSQ